MIRLYDVDDYGDEKTRQVIFAATWAASALVSGAFTYVAKTV